MKFTSKQIHSAPNLGHHWRPLGVAFALTAESESLLERNTSADSREVFRTFLCVKRLY